MSKQKHLAASIKDNFSFSEFNMEWLRFIRVIGCHPISFVSTPLTSTDPGTGHNFLFHFHFFSWATLYTIIFVTVSAVALMYWMLDIMFGGAVELIFYESQSLYRELKWKWDINTPANATNPYHLLDSMTLLSLRLGFQFIPLSALHYIYSVLMATPALISFLNGQNEFENRIKSLFSNAMEESLVQLYAFRKKVSIVNTILCFVLTVPTLPSLYFTAIQHPNVFTSKLFWLYAVIFYTIFIFVFEDTKVLLILKIVSENFQQIVNGIRYQSEKMLKENGCISINDIKRWRSIVQLARKQAKLAVVTMEGSTISILIGINISLTTSIYLLYSTIYKETPFFIGRYSASVLVYCGFQYFRIYLKASFAEQITEKESKVAETVRLLDVGPSTYDTKFTKLQQDKLPAARRLEISFITDPIISKPTKIVLSNCIRLKPSLIVGLFQHVSTYAVALIQFDSVQSSYDNV